jgi:hypothetical protein
MNNNRNLGFCGFMLAGLAAISMGGVSPLGSVFTSRREPRKKYTGDLDEYAKARVAKKAIAAAKVKQDRRAARKQADRKRNQKPAA